MVFVRHAPAALGMLLKQIDEIIGKNKPADLRGFAVFLTDDRKATEPRLKELAQQAKISDQVPLVIPENPATVKPYKIHQDADVTVVLFRKWKVVGNFAFKAGEFKEKDTQAVVAALAKIIPTKAELEQEAKEMKEAEAKRKLEAAKAEAAKKEADKKQAEAKKKADAVKPEKAKN